jgi:hypothetical protein
MVDGYPVGVAQQKNYTQTDPISPVAVHADLLPQTHYIKDASTWQIVARSCPPNSREFPLRPEKEYQ